MTATATSVAHYVGHNLATRNDIEKTEVRITNEISEITRNQSDFNEISYLKRWTPPEMYTKPYFWVYL